MLRLAIGVVILVVVGLAVAAFAGIRPREFGDMTWHRRVQEKGFKIAASAIDRRRSSAE